MNRLNSEITILYKKHTKVYQNMICTAYCSEDLTEYSVYRNVRGLKINNF